MSDFITETAQFSPGDRSSYLDDVAAEASFEPSDIPGYVHPKGKKNLYVRADDPNGQPMTKDQVLSNANQGGALYKQ